MTGECMAASGIPKSKVTGCVENEGVGVGCWTCCPPPPQAASGKSKDNAIARYSSIKRDKREREIIKRSSSYFSIFCMQFTSQIFHYLRCIDKYTYLYRR